MTRRCFLIYPCGKKFEIRIPITANGSDGKLYSVFPGSENYFECAKKKFEINNLKVIEEEVLDNTPQPASFISLTKKIRSVE